MGVGVAVGSGGSPLPQAATNSAQKATTRGQTSRSRQSRSLQAWGRGRVAGSRIGAVPRETAKGAPKLDSGHPRVRNRKCHIERPESCPC